MDKKLTCPFCGREVRIVVCDDEGNIHPDEYEDDPWSGLGYMLVHEEADGVQCPIATEPDNAATLKIKQSGKQDGLLRPKNTNGYGQIDEDDKDALEELGARIFVDEPTEYTMKMLDLFLENRK